MPLAYPIIHDCLILLIRTNLYKYITLVHSMNELIKEVAKMMDDNMNVDFNSIQSYRLTKE
jgi:hypothetical protein